MIISVVLPQIRLVLTCWFKTYDLTLDWVFSWSCGRSLTMSRSSTCTIACWICTLSMDGRRGVTSVGRGWLYKLMLAVVSQTLTEVLHMRFSPQFCMREPCKYHPHFGTVTILNYQPRSLTVEKPSLLQHFERWGWFFGFHYACVGPTLVPALVTSVAQTFQSPGRETSLGWFVWTASSGDKPDQSTHPIFFLFSGITALCPRLCYFCGVRLLKPSRTCRLIVPPENTGAWVHWCIKIYPATSYSLERRYVHHLMQQSFSHVWNSRYLSFSLALFGFRKLPVFRKVSWGLWVRGAGYKAWVRGLVSFQWFCMVLSVLYLPEESAERCIHPGAPCWAANRLCGVMHVVQSATRMLAIKGGVAEARNMRDI